MNEPSPPSSARNSRRDHVYVPWRGIEVPYRPRGGGGGQPQLWEIPDRRGHAEAREREVRTAEYEVRQEAETHSRELWPDGLTLAIHGWSDDPSFRLALDRLDSSGAVLLSVRPPRDGQPETAVVWMPFGAVSRFIRKLEQYATEAKNKQLVANIHSIRRAVLENLWQDEAPFPDDGEPRWWELWLSNNLPDNRDPAVQLRTATAELPIRAATQTLRLPGRTVALVYGTVGEVGGLLTTNCVIAEIHRPLRMSEFDQVDLSTQDELINDLLGRVKQAEPDSPVVCLLDTGIVREHPLLRDSVDATHCALTPPSIGSADRDGHGTAMAGLALYGDLRHLIGHNQEVALAHRLESVKIFDPAHPGGMAEPELYGAVVANGVALTEIDAPDRHRSFSMTVTAQGDGCTGRPSSWSVAVDSIAFGTYIRNIDGGVVLDEADPAQRRLILVSAGNVIQPLHSPEGLPDYLEEWCDKERVYDPAQAWNALTVGAYTEIVDLPNTPTFAGWRPVAESGELSPHSRTSVLFDDRWPLKPDIVLEGGNLLRNPAGTQQGSHEDMELLTTKRDGRLVNANATSAATAQAARLAARVMARYPTWWPETVRGVLVHTARWTPAMKSRISPPKLTKAQRAAMIRRYGWGVPTEERVLSSATDDVTMIIQDEFHPFRKTADNDVAVRELRLHELPWPREQLDALFGVDVEMRVTLSYFVEPNPSARGWGPGYRYPSHQLRFDVKRPEETAERFRQRVSNGAWKDEESKGPSPSPDNRWLLGTKHRNIGSLHSDVWTGTAAQIANGGAIAVVAVGGWWKGNRRADHADKPVRYALLVSLASSVSTDIYTPIAAEIGVPIEITG